MRDVDNQPLSCGDRVAFMNLIKAPGYNCNTMGVGIVVSFSAKMVQIHTSADTVISRLPSKIAKSHRQSQES